MDYNLKIKNTWKNNKQEELNLRIKYITRIQTIQAPHKIFIVHGHDSLLKEEVARILEKQGIEVVLLSEQANSGLTVFEKLEIYSEVDTAICLFTSDDVGKEKNETDFKKRARQNVIFETGYFIHKLGKGKVILICDSEVEVPSDLQGVVYNTKDDWKLKVLKELKEIGFNIDLNKI